MSVSEMWYNMNLLEKSNLIDRNVFKQDSTAIDYTQTLDLAWLVSDKMHEHGWKMTIYRFPPKSFGCKYLVEYFGGSSGWSKSASASSDNLPDAICLAAVKAIEHNKNRTDANAMI